MVFTGRLRLTTVTGNLTQAITALNTAITGLGSVGKRRASSSRARDENGRFVPKGSDPTPAGENPERGLIPYQNPNKGLAQITKISEQANQAGKGKLLEWDALNNVYKVGGGSGGGGIAPKAAPKAGGIVPKAAGDLVKGAMTTVASQVAKTAAGAFGGPMARIAVEIGEMILAANLAAAKEAFKPAIRAFTDLSKVGSSALKYAWVNIAEGAFGVSKFFTTTSMSARQLSRSFDLAASRMQQRNGGSSADAILGVQEQMHKIGDVVMASIKDAFVNPLKSLPEFGRMLSSFVGLYDPGMVNIFNIAVRDLTAVIGKALSPVLKTVTEAIRLFADYLNGFLNGGFAKDFQKLLDAFMDKFKQRMPELMVLIDHFAKKFLDEIDKWIDSIESSITASSMLGAFLGGFVSGFVRIIVALPQAFLWATSGLLKGTGWFLDGISSLLEKIPGVGKYLAMPVKGMAAHTNLQAKQADDANSWLESMVQGTNEGVKNMFGGGQEVQDLQKKLADARNGNLGFKPENSRGMAVAQNVSMGGVNDFARKAAQQSFLTGSREEKEKQKQNAMADALIQLVQNPNAAPIFQAIQGLWNAQGDKQNAWQPKPAQGGVGGGNGF